MATPHIGCEKGDIAKTVIMPGDPLRAKYIAENFLEDYKLVSEVRNMYAYTGHYKGKEITIMAHGMGIPSVGIYSYELYSFYDVEKIIRIGTCGAYFNPSIRIRDVLLVDKAYSNSSFKKILTKKKEKFEASSDIINKKIIKTAKELNINLIFGDVISSDVFYEDDNSNLGDKNKFNSVEMESFGLFTVAKHLGKEASCILTVTDSGYENTVLSAEERQLGLNTMIKLALESSLK